MTKEEAKRKQVEPIRKQMSEAQNDLGLALNLSSHFATADDEAREQASISLLVSAKWKIDAALRAIEQLKNIDIPGV